MGTENTPNAEFNDDDGKKSSKKTKYIIKSKSHANTNTERRTQQILKEKKHISCIKLMTISSNTQYPSTYVHVHTVIKWKCSAYTGKSGNGYVYKRILINLFSFCVLDTDFCVQMHCSHYSHFRLCWCWWCSVRFYSLRRTHTPHIRRMSGTRFYFESNWQTNLRFPNLLHI